MKIKLFLPLVILGLLVRIILSITTYHQDLGAITLASHYVVGNGQWLNFYENSGQDENRTIFNYQPLAYLIPSVFYAPFKSFVTNTAQNYVNADWQKTFTGSVNMELLFYKFPMLLADILIFFVLGQVLRKSIHQRKVQLFWALNPIAIYVSSVIGQVDIFVALFLLLAYLYLSQNKKYLAIVFVSLSALVKPIGLILLPFVVLEPKTNSKLKLLLSSSLSLFVGVIVYILGILPFISSTAYRHYALFADQINKTIHAGVEISTGTIIPFFFIALTLVYFQFLEKRKTTLQSVILVLLASLVFTNFHPQWLVWAMPFILLQQKGDWYFTFLCLLGWFLVLFSFDNTLHLGSVINSSLEIPKQVATADIFQKLILLGRALLISCLLWLFSTDLANKDEKTI